MSKKSQGIYNAEVADLPIDSVKEYLESIPENNYKETRNHRLTIEMIRREKWLREARKLSYEQAKLLKIPERIRDLVLKKVFPLDHKPD